MIFGETTWATDGLPFFDFVFEYVFRIFYLIWYYNKDKKTVILHRILAIVNSTYTWNIDKITA